MHNTTLCCDPEVNSSPFYRAAIASDVDALTLMLAHGAKVDWSPAEFKKPGAPAGPAGAGGGGRGVNANVGKTPSYITMSGGRGAAFSAGPGFDRIGAPPFARQATAIGRGAGPARPAQMRTPRRRTAPLLHQAVSIRRTDAIRALIAAGAKLDAVNKDNQTPLLLAEKPITAHRRADAADPAFKPRRDKREDVTATLRELMKRADDPAPRRRHCRRTTSLRKRL